MGLTSDIKTCRLTRRFALPNGFDILNENMPAHGKVRPPKIDRRYIIICLQIIIRRQNIVLPVERGRRSIEDSPQEPDEYSAFIPNIL
jgi:hypothetical protein